MPARHHVAAMLAILLAIAGCASDGDAKPRWVAAPDVDIPAYRTFGWADAAGGLPVTLLDNQIRDAVRARLTGLGYVETAEMPDFLVDHETVEQEAVQRRNPVNVGIGVGTWGGNVGGSVGTSVDVGEGDRVVRQLLIQVRALEPADRREFWVGTSAPLAERPGADAVRSAVASVMKGFPARHADAPPAS